jgi:dihydroorotate dehydrogenase electron transfer subunit
MSGTTGTAATGTAVTGRGARPQPVQELARVFANRKLGAYHAVSLVGPAIAKLVRPGQFVEVRVGDSSSFMLRRPFSIHTVQRGGPGVGSFEIVFEVVGPGTRQLAAVRPHDRVDVIGPLGQPFTIPERPANCVLVGGGYGSAPLFFLAEELRARRCRVDFVIGAATEERLLKVMDAKRAGQTLTVTTDDGSAGTQGLVTSVLPEVLRRARAGRVYACGPMAMLAAVSHVAAAARLPCEVAVEEQMGCGTGVCFSCVVPVLDSDAPPVPGAGLMESPRLARERPTRMARTCYEGPVFDAGMVAWRELGYDAVQEHEGGQLAMEFLP